MYTGEREACACLHNLPLLGNRAVSPGVAHHGRAAVRCWSSVIHTACLPDSPGTPPLFPIPAHFRPRRFVTRSQTGIPVLNGTRPAPIFYLNTPDLYKANRDACLTPANLETLQASTQYGGGGWRSR